jgi:hypothetical protein
MKRLLAYEYDYKCYVGKDLEGFGHGLFKGGLTILAFAWKY